MIEAYSLLNLCSLVEQLKHVFDIARVVDPIQVAICNLDACTPGHLVFEPYQCYAVWLKGKRCQNCVSAQALHQGVRMTKFEFVGNQTYYVISKPLLLEGHPLCLEMVTNVSENVQLGAFGPEEFAKRIIAFNQDIYLDELTGIYNRRYINEQLFLLDQNASDCFTPAQAFSIAMVDIDNLKQINDSLGHLAGDALLSAVGGLLHSFVSERRGDFAARYGGDEFLLLFRNIPTALFYMRLHQLQQRALDLHLSDYPNIQVSLSIGGICNCESPNSTTEELIALADQRLYESKLHKNNKDSSIKNLPK